MDASAAGPPSETRRPVASGRRLDIDVEVPKIQVREFHLDTNAAGIFTSNPRILTLDLPLSGVSKTLGPFNSQITDQGGLGIAAIEDLRITVTRMTGAQSEPFLMFSLEYLVSSYSYFDYWGGSALTEQVAFLNGAGGTMYIWHVDGFHLSCQDNRRPRSVFQKESNFQGWFDAWEGHAHFISGLFSFCNRSERYLEEHGDNPMRGSIR
jgi:hypothetical protein